jgi:hypothetical protein
VPNLTQNEKHYPESTLEFAINLFTDINQRINSLIACSAKDFDTLNQSFKKHHLIIKTITENASLLIESVVRIPDEYFKNCLDFLTTYKNTSKKAQSVLLKTEMHLLKLIGNFSYAQFHLNNLKQNGSTMRLLVTNIQFEPFYHKFYKELIDTIDQLYFCCQSCDQEFGHVIDLLNKSSESLNKIKLEQFNPVEAAATNAFKVLSGLFEKKGDCVQFNTLLQDLIVQNSVSSSEIITNLQFQDIIRQKIEHVQKVQEEIVSQFRKLYSNGKWSHETQSKAIHNIILQIRNVGSLQAAQLLHANSEYQKAIQTITSKFGELDLVLTNTLQILVNFFSNLEPLKDYDYVHTDNIFSSVLIEFEKLISANYPIIEAYDYLFSSNKNIFSSDFNLPCPLDSLNLIINKLNGLKLTMPSDDIMSDTLSQIIGNYHDFKENIEDLKSCLNNSRQEFDELLKPVLDAYFKHIASMEVNARLFSEKIASAFPEKILVNSLKQVMIIEKELKSSRFNLENIKYYVFFEKEVEEIISGINSLIDRINFNEFDLNADLENMERLMKHYTMRSEREIHASHTGKKLNNSDNKNEIDLF